jgi:hypothetical protein
MSPVIRKASNTLADAGLEPCHTCVGPWSACPDGWDGITPRERETTRTLLSTMGLAGLPTWVDGRGARVPGLAGSWSPAGHRKLSRAF